MRITCGGGGANLEFAQVNSPQLVLEPALEARRLLLVDLDERQATYGPHGRIGADRGRDDRQPVAREHQQSRDLDPARIVVEARQRRADRLGHVEQPGAEPHEQQHGEDEEERSGIDFAAELAALWPPASIPVLRDGEHVLGETSIIIEHIAGARLVPSLEARKWDRLCDNYVADSVQAIVADTFEERSDERAVARALGRLDMAYGMLETQLAANELLAGDEFTIADCAAAPALFYALAIHPWDEDAHRQLTRYYRALARRPSFSKVIEDARPYRHLFPLPWPADFDRYH